MYAQHENSYNKYTEEVDSASDIHTVAKCQNSSKYLEKCRISLYLLTSLKINIIPQLKLLAEDETISARCLLQH